MGIDILLHPCITKCWNWEKLLSPKLLSPKYSSSEKTRLWINVLASWGCYNEVPQTEWLNLTNVLSQSVGGQSPKSNRTMILLKVPEKDPSLTHLSGGWRKSLVFLVEDISCQFLPLFVIYTLSGSMCLCSFFL